MIPAARLETSSMSVDLAGAKEETSRILDAVHETARDLHTAGVISKRRMKEYDSLCLVPVPEYSSASIRALT